MTVCIAAMANQAMICAVTDRMITAGDIEFESQSSKVFRITSSIVIMTSGDTSFQNEILIKLHKKVSGIIQENPDEWIRVEDVAYLYVQLRNEIRKKQAENSILLPVGLNSESFITKQNLMSKDFIYSISKELLNYGMPEVSAIVTGIDAEEAHIYVVNDDNVSCRDNIGFATIGIGSRHANSQLMLAKHSCYSGFAETLLLTYIAKKRSEAAPGVGEKTNLFLMGTEPGTFTVLGAEHLKKLENVYNKICANETKLLNEANEDMEKYVHEIMQESVKQKQTDTG